jgi:hypothetical protein
MPFIQAFVVVIGVAGVFLAIRILFDLAFWLMWQIGWRLIGKAYVITWESLHKKILFPLLGWEDSWLVRFYRAQEEKYHRPFRWAGVVTFVILCATPLWVPWIQPISQFFLVRLVLGILGGGIAISLVMLFEAGALLPLLFHEDNEDLFSPSKCPLRNYTWNNMMYWIRSKLWRAYYHITGRPSYM